MKKLILLSFMLLALAFSSVAQNVFETFDIDTSKLPKVTVKAEDYDHFRQTVVYDVLPKYKFGNISTMANTDESSIYVFRHKGGRSDPDDILNPDKLILIMLAKMQPDGKYEVAVNLEKTADSKKLAKEIQKAFRSKKR